MTIKTHTIAEAAATYGVTLRALRFYEARGLLSPARVGTDRYYSEKDCARIELILKGKRMGFTLMEIERLIAEIPAEKELSGREGCTGFSLNKMQLSEQLKALEGRRDTLDTIITELRQALGAKGVS